MAINYEKTNWENGKTILEASHFEKIEQGIVDVIQEHYDHIYNHPTGDGTGGGSHNHVNMAVLNEITRDAVIEWNNKSNFSGNYNDLTNKPVFDVNKNYVDIQDANLQNQIDNIIVAISNTEIEINPIVFSEVVI